MRCVYACIRLHVKIRYTKHTYTYMRLWESLIYKELIYEMYVCMYIAVH